ncbi:hypothetical protein FB561_6517 [Kribbella amoyensis]|uniref:Uncharacterized protein n=1 Tax=Kribbella amoyensis TaxID=996641 RepID=A0A561B8B0_9ACTN|nr:hypothetical protein [Kribbella amoyensis]TWD75080.1 hypothetical protein FB561_6517 [Kribbella amoyensis]
MLASILPGLRDLRTPLTTGYLYFLTIWLAFGKDRLLPAETDSRLLNRIHDLAELLGPPAVLAAVSFAAYLLGSIVTIRTIKMPEGLLKVLKAGRDSARDQLTVWVAEQAATLEANDRGARALIGRRDLPQLFRDQLQEILDHVDVDPTDEQRALNAGLSEQELDRSRQRRALTSALTLSATDDHDALVTRLQIERETLYNDYDRLRSEAELRFSIFIPLIALAVVASALWSVWCLFTLLLPCILLGQAVRLQARADERVRQALVRGVVKSPTIEALTQIQTPSAVVG